MYYISGCKGRFEAPFIFAIFCWFMFSRDFFATNFPIGTSTHFIAKQSQKARKIASINGALHVHWFFPGLYYSKQVKTTVQQSVRFSRIFLRGLKCSNWTMRNHLNFALWICLWNFEIEFGERVWVWNLLFAAISVDHLFNCISEKNYH